MRRVLIIVGGLLLTLGAIPAASAQTGTTAYNGGTSTTLGGPTSGTVSGPVLQPGQCFNFPINGDIPASIVNLLLNGQAAGTKTVGADGTASITICNTTSASGLGTASFAVVGLHLAATAPTVTIDGRSYAAQVGTNTLTASGTGTNGAPRTITATFTLAAPAGTGGGLVRTGVRIAGFTVVGLAMVAAGLALVGATRRRRNSAPHA